MKLRPLIALFALAACGSPPDIEYCQQLGVPPGHAEYNTCLNYYHTQNNAFQADLQGCSFEADATYPPTLYDEGRTAWTHGGYSAGRYYGGETIFIEPDYARNAQVDALRQRIITPCMQAKGWKSGTSWQLGRFKGRPPQRSMQPSQAPLPWLNK